MRQTTEYLYLPGGRGDLFSVLHTPTRQPAHGALLFIHPFAEEMNKSRRMVALQARALCDRGWTVLLVDLLGCGDSAGDFGDADWDIWLDDLEAAVRWLEAHTGQHVSLWGLRFGALLAGALAGRLPATPPRLLLWAPLLRGAAALKTLLRQRLVAELGAERARETTRALRERLAAGETLELSGYAINPGLAQVIDTVELDPPPPGCTVIWIDVARTGPAPARGAASRLRTSWQERGVQVEHHSVIGAPFWSTGEIVECPELIVTTCATLPG